MHHLIINGCHLTPRASCLDAAVTCCCQNTFWKYVQSSLSVALVRCLHAQWLTSGHYWFHHSSSVSPSHGPAASVSSVAHCAVCSFASASLHGIAHSRVCDCEDQSYLMLTGSISDSFGPSDNLLPMHCLQRRRLLDVGTRSSQAACRMEVLLVSILAIDECKVILKLK